MVASAAEPSAYKIAFIGTHGVGKTTLCYGLAARLKARDVRLEVVGEVARRCPLPINRDTTVAAQAWILHSQIADEILAASRHDLVISDRSVLDNYVYLLLARSEVDPVVDVLVDSWCRSYDLLVHAPILGLPSADGLRSTDRAFQRAVEDRLERELAHRSLPVLELRGHHRDAWLDLVEATVWEAVRPAQLELL